MVDLNPKLEDLPPEERIKRLRAIKEQKQRELQEELEKKRRELEELEKAQQDEQNAAEDLEDEVLDEMEQRRGDLSALEDRIKEFQQGEEFVGEQEPEEVVREQTQVSYLSPARQAQQDLQYMIEGTPSQERQRELMRDVYSSANQIREGFLQGRPIEQADVYNLQQKVNQLAREKHDVPYMKRIETVLNAITGVTYHSKDERR